MFFLNGRSTKEMNDSSWTRLLSDLVEICFESSAIASPVVTSESPEGFLPELGNIPNTINPYFVSIGWWFLDQFPYVPLDYQAYID